MQRANTQILILTCLVVLAPFIARGELTKLKTHVRDIKDGSGHTVVLRGLNVEKHSWAYQDAAFDEVLQALSYNGKEEILFDEILSLNTWPVIQDDFRFMKKLGANLIRLQLPHYFFELIGNPGSFREASFTQLETWINWAEQEGLYLLLDLHVPYGGRQYSGAGFEGKTLWYVESERDHVIALWREIVRRTKTHFHILYEIMNEPDPIGAGVSTDMWWSFAQDIVDAIRAEGADHLLVIPCPLVWQPFELLHDAHDNLAYDFHLHKPFEFMHRDTYRIAPPSPPLDHLPAKDVMYDQSKIFAQIQSYLEFGKSNNVPVMCLEFGMILEETEEGGLVAGLNDIFTLLKQNKIHLALPSLTDLR